MGTRHDLSPFGVWQVFRLGCSAYQDILVSDQDSTLELDDDDHDDGRHVRTKAVQCPCLWWASEGTLSSCRLWVGGWYKISSGNSVGAPRATVKPVFRELLSPNSQVFLCHSLWHLIRPFNINICSSNRPIILNVQTSRRPHNEVLDGSD